MALVFKIKFQNTLRRWVVTEHSDQAANLPTREQLDAKIRDLFQLAPTTSVVITYIDKEEDVVTLAEDQDIVDACIAQGLNPLRLEVKVSGESTYAPDTQPSVETSPNLNLEALLKSVSPQATADAVKQFLSKIPQVDPNYPQATSDAVKQFLSKLPQVDPKVPVAVLLQNVQEAVNDFLKTLKRESGCASRKAGSNSSENRFENPFERTHTDQTDSQRFPFRGRGASSSILHRGVECDGCGKSPIEGPRFKSKKAIDYDLCSSCFEKMGNETDYEKIDHPVYPSQHGFYHHPNLARGRRQHTGQPPFSRPVFARGPYGWNRECPFRMPSGNIFAPSAVGGKLDARFVKDVTIFDGTELAPCTKFTKIWRLSNIGTIPWPQHTQLVHIGGDMLSSEEAVNLELPEGGLPCGAEVEGSVDLIAPEKAGRYVSHWRLMSPSGQKFGHRVWVVIQVVPQDEQSPQLYESLRGEEPTQEGKPHAEVTTEEGNKESTSDHRKGKDKVVSLQRREAMASDTVVLDHGTNVDVDIPENVNKDRNAMVDEPKSTQEHLTDKVSEIEDLANINGSKMENVDELDGFSVVEKPVENIESKNVIDSKSEQEKHLQLLEGMGYTDQELNVDLLQKNNQNLELTVEDLVATSGWDDVLKDLQEMGFNDRQTNRRLLIKNEGSVKRVVKELVQMEKERVGQTKDKR